MSLSNEEIKELSRILAARAGRGRREPPKLRLIVPPTPKLLDHLARDAHLKRIAHMAKAYRLQWLVEQATFSVASVSCLEDCDLIRLLNDIERARECIVEGVSFEDAGLVQCMRTDEPRERPPARVNRTLEREAERADMYISRMSHREPEPATEDPPF